MKLEKISKLKVNKQNPRVIKDEKYDKLYNSVHELKVMMSLRPIIVDEDMVVLGGNQRLAVCKDLGWKEVPTNILTNEMIDNTIKERLELLELPLDADEVTLRKHYLTRQHIKDEVTIKDNVSSGQWEWDMLANNYDAELLNKWSLDVWQPEEIDLGEFFAKDDTEKETKGKIVLEYSEADYEIINDAFNKLDGSKEDIVWKLLGL